MSKFLHTWVWVVNEHYFDGWWLEKNGWWRETFINLEAVNCFTVSREVSGRERASVDYRDGSGAVIAHTIEELQKLLFEPGHLIPHKLGKTVGDSHDEP